MRKFSHLFFDLDNTLWDFRSNSRSAMEVTFRHFKLHEHELEFAEFFDTYNKNNDALWSDFRAKKIFKKELIKLRFDRTFQHFGIHHIEAEIINTFFLKELPKQTKLIPQAREILDYLKSKGYKLFIITNGFKEVQHDKLQSSGLTEYFEKVFISEEIKTPKPGKGIFEHALKSSNASKKMSLMIGDDWEGDIVGATQFGIKSIYFNPTSAPLPGQLNEKQAKYLFAQINHLSSLEQLI